MPFAGYKNFDDCVARNKSKGDPKAYCATIMRQVEGKAMEMDKEIFYKTGTIDLVKGEDGETNWEGILSSTGIDYDDECLSRKALEMASKDLMNNSTVFFNHDHKGLGVGKIVKAWVEDNTEKSFLKIRVKPSKADGVKDVVTQVNEGVLKCMSIGGKKLKTFSKYHDGLQKDITTIDEVKALEGSIVGIGANPDAMMTRMAKSLFIDSLTKQGDDTMEKAEEPSSIGGHKPVAPDVPPVVKGEKEPDKMTEDKEKKKDKETEKSLGKLTCPECGKSFDFYAIKPVLATASGGGSPTIPTDSATGPSTPHELQLFTPAPTVSPSYKSTETEVEKDVDVTVQKGRKGLVGAEEMKEVELKQLAGTREEEWRNLIRRRLEI